MRRQTWLIATHNRGKLREFEAMLGADFDFVDAASQAIDAAPETATTFVENALAKARHGATCSGLPTIADDSGLVVDALGGLPGVHSARYAGSAASDDDNIAKLLAAMQHLAGDQRNARFVCVLVALRNPADPLPLIAHGIWPGRIATRRSGSGGFGYDPVFEVSDSGVTAAELGKREKNRRSHRGRALAELRRQLQS